MLYAGWTQSCRPSTQHTLHVIPHQPSPTRWLQGQAECCATGPMWHTALRSVQPHVPYAAHAGPGNHCAHGANTGHVFYAVCVGWTQHCTWRNGSRTWVRCGTLDWPPVLLAVLWLACVMLTVHSLCWPHVQNEAWGWCELLAACGLDPVLWVLHRGSVPVQPTDQSSDPPPAHRGG